MRETLVVVTVMFICGGICGGWAGLMIGYHRGARDQRNRLTE